MIDRKGAPAAAIRVPNVWRRSWNLTRRTPARPTRGGRRRGRVVLPRRGFEVAVELARYPIGHRYGTRRSPRLRGSPPAAGVIAPDPDDAGRPSRRPAIATPPVRLGVGRSSPPSGRASARSGRVCRRAPREAALRVLLDEVENVRIGASDARAIDHSYGIARRPASLHREGEEAVSEVEVIAHGLRRELAVAGFPEGEQRDSNPRPPGPTTGT